MSNVVAFFVPGNVVPKERARGANGRFYTPARTRQWEKEIKQWAQIEMRGRELLAGRLEVELRFYGIRANADIENCSKAVCDAMNKVAYNDDKQIDHLHLHREAKYARKGVYIRIVELSGEELT